MPSIISVAGVNREFFASAGENPEEPAAPEEEDAPGGSLAPANTPPPGLALSAPGLDKNGGVEVPEFSDGVLTAVMTISLPLEVPLSESLGATCRFKRGGLNFGVFSSVILFCLEVLQYRRRPEKFQRGE